MSVPQVSGALWEILTPILLETPQTSMENLVHWASIVHKGRLYHSNVQKTLWSVSWAHIVQVSVDLALQDLSAPLGPSFLSPVCLVTTASSTPVSSLVPCLLTIMNHMARISQTVCLVRRDTTVTPQAWPRMKWALVLLDITALKPPSHLCLALLELTGTCLLNTGRCITYRYALHREQVVDR